MRWKPSDPCETVTNYFVIMVVNIISMNPTFRIVRCIDHGADQDDDDHKHCFFIIFSFSICYHYHYYYKNKKWESIHNMYVVVLNVISFPPETNRFIDYLVIFSPRLFHGDQDGVVELQVPLLEEEEDEGLMGGFQLHVE